MKLMLKTGDHYLACEIGNTRIKWKGFVLGGEEKESGYFPTHSKPTVHFLQRAAQTPLFVATVNPQRLCQLVEEVGGSLFEIGKDIPIPIMNLTKKPSQVGVDRLLGAVAAYRLLGPCVVVDIGTAITVNLVKEGPSFLGGAILPGPELWAKALCEHTSQLPFVKLEEVPAYVVGGETSEAISSGIGWGVLGAVKLLLDRIEREHGKLRLCLTGGGAGIFSPHIEREHSLIGDLVLQGIRETVESHFG